MTARVLVVDDSGFFRRRVAEILESDRHIEVVGTAENGAEAVEKTLALRPDVISMDIEMPVMDGITAVREIMKKRPTPILMFSSLTTEGAQATLDALDAGALDFLPKRFEDISQDRSEARRLLCARIRILGARGLGGTSTAQCASPSAAAAPRVPVAPARARPGQEKGKYKLVAIGTSTGGPVALQRILAALPKDFPLPILLIQHMPASFTPAFANRLNNLCRIEVREAADGDVLEPGTALLAPGGRQMVLEANRGNIVVRVCDMQGQNYKPSVDISFQSAAEVFPGQALAIVLTGMGADGREGARQLKKLGSTVWIQDEQSSVVYGMPGAVAEAGLADYVLSLSDIGACLTVTV